MVDRETIERLARLARVDVAAGEIDTLREEMRRIVAFVDGLSEPGEPEADDDAGAHGSAPPVDGPDRLPLRDDRAETSPADPLLRLAPRTRERFVEVPRVIEDPGA